MSRTRACLKNAFCFNMFSAYYNNNSGQSFKKQLHRNPHPSGDSPNHFNNKQQFSPPQPKHSSRRESNPYICGLGARFGCEHLKRAFKPPRLKSQIQGLDSLRGRFFGCGEEIPIQLLFPTKNVNIHETKYKFFYYLCRIFHIRCKFSIAE